MKKLSTVLVLSALIVLGTLIVPISAHALTQSDVDAICLIVGCNTTQRAGLTALVGGSSGGSCPVLSQPLTIGSKGQSVVNLQTYLVGQGHLVMPAGVAMGYFGPLTQSAVSKWQAANGVVPAAGYFGPLSLAKYNSVCKPVSAPPSSSSGNNNGSGDTDNTNSFFSSNKEGYLDNFDQISKYGGEEVGEGQKDARILGVELEAKDSDQMIERVIVEIDTPTGNDDLEDFIDNVSIWLDGKLLDRMDVDDASHSRKIDKYTFRFTGLEGIVKRGKKAALLVGVSGARNVDSADEGNGWTATIPINGIRASSPNRTIEEYDNQEFSETFTVESFASASGVELRLTESDDNPDTMTVQVNSTSETSNVLLLDFFIEAKNSDIELFDFPVLLTISSTTQNVSNIANRLTLEIGGEEFSENIPAGGGNIQTITFDDLDFTIKANKKVTARIYARIKKQSGNYDEGVTIKADIGSAERDAIDAEDESGEGLGVSDKKGIVVGEEQSLRTKGAILNVVSVKSRPIENNDTITSDNEAEFEIEFNVTAFEQDVFVAKTTERGSTVSPTNGVNYLIKDSSAGGIATSTGSVSGSLTSTAQTSGGFFKVSNGQTKKFTLTAVFDPELTSFYQLQLDTLNFNSIAAAPTEQEIATPVANFDTPDVFIKN